MHNTRAHDVHVVRCTPHTTPAFRMHTPHKEAAWLKPSAAHWRGVPNGTETSAPPRGRSEALLLNPGTQRECAASDRANGTWGKETGPAGHKKVPSSLRGLGSSPGQSDMPTTPCLLIPVGQEPDMVERVLGKIPVGALASAVDSASGVARDGFGLQQDSAPRTLLQ